MHKTKREHRPDCYGTISGPGVTLLLAGASLCALVTDRIGVHPIIGAFLFGVTVPVRPEAVRQVVGRVQDVAVTFLLPLFFVTTGLRIKPDMLGPHLLPWLVALLVLTVAVVGKWGGCAVAGRALGMRWPTPCPWAR